MAEQENNTSLVPAEGIALKVREFNASGGKNEYAMSLPKEGPWLERQLKALCLKAGPMADQNMGNILCAIMYAEEMGLSVILGDLYFVNGRIATTADAKIRHALGSGLVAGYDVQMTKGEKISIPYEVKGKSQTWQGDDLHCKITVKVKGWESPVIYEADLRDWFNGANAAWREHTAFMFRKNCLSKALSEVAPLGVDADEIPADAKTPALPDDLLKALTQIQAGNQTITGDSNK
jgi:hypothetical protein